MSNSNDPTIQNESNSLPGILPWRLRSLAEFDSPPEEAFPDQTFQNPMDSWVEIFLRVENPDDWPMEVQQALRQYLIPELEPQDYENEEDSVWIDELQMDVMRSQMQQLLDEYPISLATVEMLRQEKMITPQQYREFQKTLVKNKDDPDGKMALRALQKGVITQEEADWYREQIAGARLLKDGEWETVPGQLEMAMPNGTTARQIRGRMLRMSIPEITDEELS